jgi:hypothetical protein
MEVDHKPSMPKVVRHAMEHIAMMRRLGSVAYREPDGRVAFVEANPF